MDINLNDQECHEIEFQNALGGSLGKLIFTGDKLEFVGCADEAAKVFIDECKKQWSVK